MSDYEAYFIVDKELEEAPLLDDAQKVLIRRWLHRFVDTKLKLNAPAEVAAPSKGEDMYINRIITPEGESIYGRNH